MNTKLNPETGPDIRLPNLDDLESDAHNIREMLAIANEGLEQFSTNAPVPCWALDRHSAVIWINRDLVEKLAQNIGQLASGRSAQQAHQSFEVAP